MRDKASDNRKSKIQNGMWNYVKISIYKKNVKLLQTEEKSEILNYYPTVLAQKT